MGMSIHVVGYRPPDDEWERMKAVYVACEEAGVDIPDKVQEFFHYDDPQGMLGIEVGLGEAVERWDDGESRSGYEVDLTRLPDGVRYLRFYYSV